MYCAMFVLVTSLCLAFTGAGIELDWNNEFYYRTFMRL